MRAIIQNSFRSLIAAGAIFGIPNSLLAVTLVHYDSLSSASPGRLTAGMVADDTTASLFSWGSGYNTSPTVVSTLANVRGLPVYMAAAPAPGTGNPNIASATANADGDYFFFTLTADPGKTLSLSSLSLEVQSASNGKREFSVYAIPTGGTNSGETFAFAKPALPLEAWSVPTATMASNDPSSMLMTVNFSSILAFQGIDTVEIRMIFHGTGSNPSGGASRDSYINNVLLQGEVIPEPSSGGFLFLTVIGLLFIQFRCRRRGLN